MLNLESAAENSTKNHFHPKEDKVTLHLRQINFDEFLVNLRVLMLSTLHTFVIKMCVLNKGELLQGEFISK